MAETDTRGRLLDVAWDLAQEADVRELTLAEVAERAGVSRQAIYLHFSNRATLFLEMARRVDRASGFISRLVGTRALESRQGFRRMLEEWLAYVPRILPVTRALEAAVAAGDDGAEGYQERMSEWRSAVRVAMKKLANDGHLSRVWDVESASDWVWSRILPAVYDQLVNVRGWSHDDVVTRTVASLEAELLSAN